MVSIQNYTSSPVSENNFNNISESCDLLKKNTGDLNTFLKNAKNSPWVKPVAAALAISVGVIAHRAIGSNSELMPPFFNSKWYEGLKSSIIDTYNGAEDAYNIALNKFAYHMVDKDCQGWESGAKNGHELCMTFLELAWERKDCLAADQDKASIRADFNAVITRQCRDWTTGTLQGNLFDMSYLKQAWNDKKCLATDDDKEFIISMYNKAVSRECQKWESLARKGSDFTLSLLEDAWSRKDCLDQDQASIRHAYHQNKD